MIITLVAAASENNVIGKGGALPWHLPNDMKHFREVTSQKPVVMGRKTHESIGRPLPGRKNIVITRQEKTYEGCETVASLEEAIELLKNEPEICIIGGGEIYSLAMNGAANKIELTRVHTDIDGDAFFPEIGSEWEMVSEEEFSSDAEHAYDYSFQTFVKKGL